MPRVRKTKEGKNLKRWFKEKWIDVRTGKPCGRRKGEKEDSLLQTLKKSEPRDP